MNQKDNVEYFTLFTEELIKKLNENSSNIERLEWQESLRFYVVIYQEVRVTIRKKPKQLRYMKPDFEISIDGYSCYYLDYELETDLYSAMEGYVFRQKRENDKIIENSTVTKLKKSLGLKE